jgi:hypothetical protein
MKDIREMATNGRSMEDILKYVQGELQAAEKICKEKEAARIKAEQEAKALAEKQNKAAETLVNACFDYCKICNLVPTDMEATDEFKQFLQDMLKNLMLTAAMPAPKKPTEPVYMSLDDEETLADIVKEIFG